MHGCMDVWMYGCMDVCMDVWMYVWMDGCMYVSVYMSCMYTYTRAHPCRAPICTSVHPYTHPVTPVTHTQYYFCIETDSPADT